MFSLFSHLEHCDILPHKRIEQNIGKSHECSRNFKCWKHFTDFFLYWPNFFYLNEILKDLLINALLGKTNYTLDPFYNSQLSVASVLQKDCCLHTMITLLRLLWLCSSKFFDQHIGPTKQVPKSLCRYHSDLTPSLENLLSR